jgi:hypothetical protein
MSGSTLTPSNLPAGPDRRLHQGHGTAALGPSDSSDSGSDRDTVDSDLDSDSDRQGTGERGAAAQDEAARDGYDIDTDHVERIVPDTDEED